MRGWPRAARESGLVFMLMLSRMAIADGVAIDRVYDPYVQPLETEIEFRSIVATDDNIPDTRKHLLGVGRSISDRWAAEIYVVGSATRDDDLAVDAYEFELKWQITEQGEYAFDWGAVFELEREVEENVWEFSATALSARDFGRWTAIANAGLVYEWGGGIENELETELRMQARYRYREMLEPAMELHLGQDTAALGPALTGLYRFVPGKKLRWEAGAFWALDDNTPDQVLKFSFEFEF